MRISAQHTLRPPIWGLATRIRRVIASLPVVNSINNIVLSVGKRLSVAFTRKSYHTPRTCS